MLTLSEMSDIIDSLVKNKFSTGCWKENFEKRLFEEYGLTPEYYEDLGNGIYQVYVKKGDNIVPFVTVDSATGDYHG